MCWRLRMLFTLHTDIKRIIYIVSIRIIYFSQMAYKPVIRHCIKSLQILFLFLIGCTSSAGWLPGPWECHLDLGKVSAETMDRLPLNQLLSLYLPLILYSSYPAQPTIREWIGMKRWFSGWHNPQFLVQLLVWALFCPSLLPHLDCGA